MKNVEIENIKIYIKDFPFQSFIKSTVGQYKISELFIVWVFAILFNAVAAAICITPISIMITVISITSLFISTFHFKGKGYHWFLYKFSYTVSLEFSFLNLILNLEYEGSIREYMLMLTVYILVSMCMIGFSIHQVNNKIKKIKKQEQEKKAANNIAIIPIICIGPPLGIIMSSTFPEMVAPFSLLTVSIFFFLMAPFLIVYYYARKFNLSEDLLIDNEKSLEGQ